MGLTIHFQYRFQGNDKALEQVLSRLREQFLQLPLEHVGEIESVQGLKYQHGYGNLEGQEYLSASLASMAWIYGDYLFKGTSDEKERQAQDWFCAERLERMRGYQLLVQVMEGCESFGINLVEYKPNHWFGAGFTKTQYAQVFEPAHLLVIQMLDYCKQEKILKSVSDEGDYWKSRDLQKLRKAIGGYRQLVASVTKQLSSILKNQGMQLGGAAIEEKIRTEN